MEDIMTSASLFLSPQAAQIAKAFGKEEFIRIRHSWMPQLNATFNSYKDEYGHHINKDLKNEKPEDFLDSLRIAIKCICYPERYFANVLRLAIDKLGQSQRNLQNNLHMKTQLI